MPKIIYVQPESHERSHSIWSWPLSIANSMHKLGSAKHVCDVPSTNASFSDTKTYWCLCVSTPWADLVNVPLYYGPGLSTTFSVGGLFLGTGIFVQEKLSSENWNQAGKFVLTASAWCLVPPFSEIPVCSYSFFFCANSSSLLNHYPSLLIWLHLKCCCWRLRECHFIYDNVIQILVYEKNWHTLTLFSWALIDA